MKKKIPDQEEFYDQFLTSIFSHVNNTDLIITSEKIKQREGFVIQYYKNIDLEELAFQKINNIFLTEFDDIDSKFLRTLIVLKSKKTEIIGVSNNYNKIYKKFQLEIQKFKDIGFTNDQTSIALILKNNIPSNIVNTYMNRYRNKIKNLNAKEINNINDIIQLIKK